MSDSMIETVSHAILIVEDDPIIAMDLEMTLEGVGYRIFGAAPSIDAALRLLDRGAPHAALLDVNLKGEAVFPVAAKLVAMRTPFVFLTGHTAYVLPSPYLGRPLLAKPYKPAVLLKTLAASLDKA